MDRDMYQPTLVPFPRLHPACNRFAPQQSRQESITSKTAGSNLGTELRLFHIRQNQDRDLRGSKSISAVKVRIHES